MKIRFKSKLPDDLIIVENGIIPITQFNPELDHMPKPDEIKICQKWIEEYAKPYSKESSRVSSYSLKHQVEDFTQAYVSNGAFISAALSLDFSMKFIQNNPNAYIGMKLLTGDEKWKHIRPTSFSKWLFKKKNDNCKIGDLARDALSDKKWPRRATKFIDFWDYLTSIDVSAGIVNSLSEAWTTYKGHPPPVQDETVIANCKAFYNGECEIIQYDEVYGEYPCAPEGTKYIYVLFEEHEEYDEVYKVRYVGQTVRPHARLKQHIVKPGNIEKLKWVCDLLNRECFPQMAIITCVPINESQIIESAYIYAFADYERRFGQKRRDVLLNKTII